MMRRAGRSPIGSALMHAALCACGATMLAPFAWMLATSLKSESEVFQKHVLPSATSLGNDGVVLRARDGSTLYEAITLKGTDGFDVLDERGNPRMRRGDPIVVRTGNPDCQGAKSDRARSVDGENLSDDLGLPIANGQVMDDVRKITAMGGVARFRDARIFSKFAEPVLVPRDFDAGENEQLAKAWFVRYADNWEDMVAKRWNGLVPLMLTAGLRDEWATASGKAEPLRARDTLIRNPHESHETVYYQFKDLSWSELGAPVRNSRRETAIVDQHGSPLIYSAPFPLYVSDEDPIKRDANTNLLVYREGAEEATTVLGRELEVDSHLRLLWSNYQTVLADPSIKMSLFAWNSLFMSVCVVALQLFTSSLAAFAFSRLSWPGRDKIFFAYIATLMIPGMVTQIPNYLILQQFGWINSFYGLVIPLAASAFGTFMLRQFMLTLPKELEEAARIDGAGVLRIWWSIILPLCKPALITLAIFTFAGTWQSMTWPLIIAPEEAVRVLPVALKNFSDKQANAYNLLMAASLVMMLPMIALFIFGQKYFVHGIQMGGVKG
jgi:multiple sugar transport system permease protein